MTASDSAPPPEPAGKSKDLVAPRCLVCGEGLTRNNLVLCQECHAPHHERCWSFNKGCATYACRCRTFVAPPGGVQDILELEFRGRPSLTGVLSALVIFALASALLKPYVLVSKPLAKAMLRFLKPLCWALGLTSLLGPLVTRRRFLFDRQLGKVGRRLLIGPVPVQDKAGWMDFHQVAGLEVRLAEVPGRHPFETRKGIEVWLRETDGTRHLVDRASWEEREAVLKQASEVAELLDTTLGLPRGLTNSRPLPPGLANSLAGLPHREQAPLPLPNPLPLPK